MREHALLRRDSPAATDDTNLIHSLAPALAQAFLPDVAEKMGLFGRWWCHAQSGQWVLSTGAARLLDAHPGRHTSATHCFAQVVPEDARPLMANLATLHEPGQTTEREFRIINELDGLRWLRLVPSPHGPSMPGVASGIVVDVTSTRLAAMRERFCFESTQFLIGTPTLGEAVTKVIQLVCDNLGWECGAYWSPTQ
jgi:hypothetical protein